MTDAPERIPLKARVRAMTFDPDDPIPNMVTSSAIIGTGTLCVEIDAPTAIKLDLGAGKIVRPGHIPMGRDYGTEIYPLCYCDESVAEIVASHVLEHFSHFQVQAVVKDWARALKHGGRIRIAVPDFGKITSAYICEPDGFAVLERCVMGGQTDANDFHRSLFDRERLRRLMAMAGLVIVGSWESEIADCAREPISLNLEGRKP